MLREGRRLEGRGRPPPQDATNSEEHADGRCTMGLRYVDFVLASGVT